MATIDFGEDTAAVKPRRLPGASAFTWNDRCRTLYKYLLAPATVALVVAALLVAFFGAAFGFVLAIVLVIFLAGGMSELLLLSVVVPVKERRELEAGYTTFPGRHLESNQLLPDADVVIRRAGDPYLDVASFRAAQLRSRAPQSE